MLQQSGIQGFSEAVFHNAYPVVNIDLLDESVPLEVTMNAWSPLIPVDLLNSSLPAAVIEWDLVNPGRKKMTYSILFMIENPLNPALQGDASISERLAITSHSVSGWEGITFSNYQGESPGSESGAIRIMTPGHSNMSLLHYSDRTDADEHFKREFLTDGILKSRGDDVSQIGNEPGVAAIHISGTLQPGESVNIPFLFSWHIQWQISEGQSAKCKVAKSAEGKAAKAKTEHTDETSGMVEVQSTSNENLYFQRFTDIDHLSGYLVNEFEKLRKKTLQFSHAIITSTVPPGVVDTMMTDLAVAIGK
ncbi:MAG: GH116 family glycosyl-hydrolase [Candidatus Campbellbacteria bacterium]|nr:GH116 family glycosyl-hydrolase [Candidatus Campbellbacteria bacterium]